MIDFNVIIINHCNYINLLRKLYMFRVENIIGFRYLALIITCTTDLLFLLIVTLYYNYITYKTLWVNLGMHAILLGNNMVTFQ